MANANQIVSRVLPTLVDGTFQSEASFKWREALPIIKGLPSSEGVYAVENPVNFLGDVNAQGGVGRLESLPAVTLADLGSGVFETSKYGFHQDIAEEDLKDPSDGIPVVGRAQGVIRRTTWIQLERATANLTLGNVGGYSTVGLVGLPALDGNAVGTAWNLAGAEPTKDLLAFFDVLSEQGNGLDPDTIHLPRDVARALSLSEDMRGYAGSAAGVGLAGSGQAGERALNFARLEMVLNDLLFGGAGKVVIFSAVANTVNSALTPVPGRIGTTGTIWMGRTLDSAPAVTVSGVKLNPVAAANFMFEDWKMGNEALPQDMGSQVYGKIRCGIQAVNKSLGYNMSSVLV